MTVKRNKKDQLVITLDARVDVVAVQRILDRMVFMERTANWKQVAQRDIETIADSITAAYWKQSSKQLAGGGRR